MGFIEKVDVSVSAQVASKCRTVKVSAMRFVCFVESGHHTSNGNNVGG